MDSSGRLSIFPPDAPDSTIYFVITDSFPIDTTAPQIQLYGHWRYCWDDIDSLTFGFIITEESPWEAAFNWGDVVLTDTLPFAGFADETLIVRIPRTGAVSLDWSLSAVDSGGNFAETPLSRSHFAENFVIDFHSDYQPGAPVEETSWNWLPDGGWSVSLADTALDFLPLPLFEATSPLSIVIHGDFYFGPSSGGLLRVVSEGWDTVLTGPSLLPPTNPHFPGASGITVIGDSAAFTFVPPTANTVYTIEIIAASADTSFWHIDSISFAKTTGIPDTKLPRKADLRVYPNPFNSSCRIEFSGDISGIEIIDITGRSVRNFDFAIGQNSIVWDGLDNHGLSVPTGVYLVRAGGCEIVKKTVYIK
ncbi:MAG TPA: T9SS type A sorting domain-containing protein [candidate division Zixibacteria bacterium]|nr:T9SS type A sorting domain-containing protein [candidate division Zixibacteria bacterium]